MAGHGRHGLRPAERGSHRLAALKDDMTAQGGRLAARPGWRAGKGGSAGREPFPGNRDYSINPFARSDRAAECLGS